MLPWAHMTPALKTLSKDLERIGLTDKEAAVYLAALELGNASVKAIAAKATLNRPVTHIILESLTKRGLASAVKEGETTIYAAEHPKQIELILQQEQMMLAEKQAILNDVVPQLTSLFHRADSHPIVKIYLGPDGARAMDQDGMRNRRRNAISYSFTALDVLEDFNSDLAKFAEKRILGKEALKVIYTHRDGPQADMTNPKELRESRFIPKNRYPFDSSIVIRPWYGLRIFSHRKNEFVGIAIESKELAKTMKSIFDLCWDSLESK